MCKIMRHLDKMPKLPGQKKNDTISYTKLKKFNSQMISSLR